MESITINRNEELQIVKDALDTLLDSKRLLRTPIVEYFGVEGIGKTALLREVSRQCDKRRIKYIWINKLENTEIQFTQRTQKLLQEKKKGVVIIDSLNDISDEEFRAFETDLLNLIEDRFLLVVLASSSEKIFENSRSVTRLLTKFRLQSLKHEYWSTYLEQFGSSLSTTARNLIYDWTKGYPLAMDIMVEAILEQDLDVDNEKDQRLLLSLLIDRVINQKLLAKAKNDFFRIEKLITFLSVPRRFNLAIMQDIIKEFADEFTLNTLEYVALPNNINAVAPVLYWNLQHSGYCVDDPVRNLFLLKLQYQDPDSYYKAHIFLANMNKTLAAEVTGLDHIRYVEEYLYHFIKRGATVDELEQEIISAVQQLTETGSMDQLVQFREELSRDQDFSNVLASKIHNINDFIQKQIEALQESKETAVAQDNDVESSDSSLPHTLPEEG